MQFFFRNCSHILTRTQGKKFEDMFLIKIAREPPETMNWKAGVEWLWECSRQYRVGKIGPLCL